MLLMVISTIYCSTNSVRSQFRLRLDLDPIVKLWPILIAISRATRRVESSVVTYVINMALAHAGTVHALSSRVAAASSHIHDVIHCAEDGLICLLGKPPLKAPRKPKA